MQLLSDFFQTLPHFCLFTTLHPLIVHLPVTLIPFSLFLFIFSVILEKYDFKIVTNITLVIGLFGAILATFLVHPHDLVLSYKTEEILNMHEAYIAEFKGGFSQALSNDRLYHRPCGFVLLTIACTSVALQQATEVRTIVNKTKLGMSVEQTMLACVVFFGKPLVLEIIGTNLY